MSESNQARHSRIWLIRHGEPEAEAQGRCYGRQDWGLSNRGRSQAQSVARALSGEPLAAVYASPRRRAQESASFLGTPKRLAVTSLQGFCEMDFGCFEGLKYEEIEKQYPEIYEQWMVHPTEVQFPGGESFQQMKTRVLTTAAELRRRHRGQVIAIVSHGGVNRILIADALGMPSEHIFRIAQRYVALNLIAYYDDVPSVELVNGLPSDALV